jgi:hypothetical protein
MMKKLMTFRNWKKSIYIVSERRYLLRIVRFPPTGIMCERNV